MRALGFLGTRQPGNGEFPFSHIVPDDELCSLSDGGWVFIQLGGGGKRSECPRPAINFIKVKGDRRRPAKNAEFSKYADVVPAVELFQGFPWTDVPGPAPGPRTARGHPEPLVMAQFKCVPRTWRSPTGEATSPACAVLFVRPPEMPHCPEIRPTGGP